jgi:transposase
VAPFAADSGKRKGQRFVWGGRADVRSVLYMATLSAKRHNPLIKPFFERLIAAGKPFKLAMTACMRKLLTILNVMLKTNQPWNPAQNC